MDIDSNSNDAIDDKVKIENKKSREKWNQLLHSTNPFQSLFDIVSEHVYNKMIKSDDLSNNISKIIVSYIGYIESNINDITKKKKPNYACSTPNRNNIHNCRNHECCMLLIPPNKSKNYSFYTLKSIEFHLDEDFSRNQDITFLYYISIFDENKPIKNMELIYKSKKMFIPKRKRYGLVDGLDIVNLDDINCKLNCSEIYIFWFDVIKGLMNWALFNEDEETKKQKERHFMKDIYILNYENLNNYKYEFFPHVKYCQLTFY
eukprot:527486_1